MEYKLIGMVQNKTHFFISSEKYLVLVSAGIELIFFLVAGIVLCFGFSRKIMLITH